MQTARRIEINLLQIDRTQNRKQMMIAAVLLVVIAMTGIMGGMYTVAVKRLAAEKKYNHELKSHLEKYQREAVSTDNIKQAQKRIQEHLLKIEELDKSRVSYIDLLAEIQKAASRGINFNQLSIEDGKISISGKASSRQEVASFLAGLRASSWINNVSSVTASGGREPAAPITFNIQAEWRAAHR